MKVMKLLKICLIYALTVLLFGFAVKVTKDSLDASKADEVVLRFAVTSKTYVFDEGDNNLNRFINLVYDYAGTKEYKGVDVFVVNGDLTGDGSEMSFAAVDNITTKLLRDDGVLYTTIGEMDYANESIQADHSKILRNGMDYAVNINGYGFVFLSSEYSSYASKVDWLDNTLASMTEYSDKPVFVFQYAALGNTFYGTETWYTYETEMLMNIYEKYDTVVNFASSTVGPGNTGRSIFQKNATYVNTGGMSNIRLNYSEFGYDTSSDMVNSRFTNVSQCKIVEVYGNGKVEIFTMDLNTGNLYKNPDETDVLKFVVYPGCQEKYLYTNEMNISQERPVFAEDAKIAFSETEDGKVKVLFDAAKDSDGVLFYNIVIYDMFGNEISNTSTYSDFALYDRPDQLERIIGNVQFAQIGKISITPFDIFGSSGKSLSTE